MSTALAIEAPTPMLQQYLQYKRDYPECFILFQVGDFYELFYQDAIEVSKILNLTLTSRDKNSPQPVPMAGVPISVVDNYIERLTEAGHSVAVISQSATAQNGKAAVERYLERIITPGIRVLGNSEQVTGARGVAALYMLSDSDFALAFSDVQTGIIYVRDLLALPQLFSELGRESICELVLPATISVNKVDRRLRWVNELEGLLPDAKLRFRAEPLLASGNGRDYGALAGYAALGEGAKKAVRLLLNYIDEATVGPKLIIRSIEQKRYDSLMALDATTRRNLEVVANSRSGGTEGTLLAVVDRTLSAGGRRLLREWLINPLVEIERINDRHDAVEALITCDTERRALRDALRFIADLERIATRLELKVALPRELAALRDSLEQLENINPLLEEIVKRCPQASILAARLESLLVPDELRRLLCDALLDQPEASIHQGNIIRAGYNEELDRLRAIKSDGRSWMSNFELSERERTGITSLKVRYNGVLGYFIEVTSANSSRVPDDYIRRQSTANSERFTTSDLRKYEEQVLKAEGGQFHLERRLYEELRESASQHTSAIREVSGALSEVDALLSFAEVSEQESYRRPAMLPDRTLQIAGGKHPVLAQILRSDFIETDIQLDGQDEAAIILTGPNMGGKSTYLRQIGLISILAQAGCFVPARSAKLGIVDKIFARIGASDNLSEGESTFMVEMREASYIIANASEKSLVLIDEIGRGTATADGLSLAQAILEWIVLKLRSRLLFATHFHELTGLEERLPGVKNYSVASFEKDGHVVFTHEIKRGAASRSYGLEVAALAGLPGKLLHRARSLLQLESPPPVVRQLNIFDSPETLFERQEDEKAINQMASIKKTMSRLCALKVNELTPLEALNLLDGLVKECSEYDAG